MVLAGGGSAIKGLGALIERRLSDMGDADVHVDDPDWAPWVDFVWPWRSPRTWEEPDPRLSLRTRTSVCGRLRRRNREETTFTLGFFGLDMPQLSTGDKAPAIVLPAIDGSTFDMSNLRKKVILTFFRFSTCPLCNMRIRKKQRWNEFSSDTVMVGVFDADIDDLRKRMRKHDAPFTIVADESYGAFESNGVSKSFGKFVGGCQTRSPCPRYKCGAMFRSRCQSQNSPPYRLTSSSTKVAMLWMRTIAKTPPIT